MWVSRRVQPIVLDDELLMSGFVAREGDLSMIKFVGRLIVQARGLVDRAFVSGVLAS